MNTQLKDILDNAEDAVFNSFGLPPEKGEDIILSAVDKLLVYVGKDTTGAVSYALGYCWYHMPKDTEERKYHAEKWLTHALTEDYEHHYARVYLGYLFFDLGRYQEARQLFEIIPVGYFGTYGQIWQDIKVQELIVCCKIYENPTDVNIEDLLLVRDTYLATSEEDAPLPVELVNTLIWTAENVSMTTQLFTMIKSCVDWLNIKQYAPLFSKEIQKLCKVLYL